MIPAANMTYTRSQNYTNMVVGKLGLQTIQIVVVVLLFDVFVPTSAHFSLFMDKWLYLNVNLRSMSQCCTKGEQRLSYIYRVSFVVILT
jgi:hypothetical protein